MHLLALSVAPAASAPGTNDIRAVRPPVQIPLGWLWLAWVALALALALLAWWYWRKRRGRPAPVVAPPPIPPHVRALERLEAALGLLGEPDAFVVAVSGALREYLEERFVLRAPERTTEEFLLELRGSDLLNPAQKDSLAAFLAQCDLVKFARLDPGVPALRQLQQAAVSLVGETRPAPVSAEVRV